MAFVHGKATVYTLNAVDLSTYTNTMTFTRGADVHDTTTYGKNDHCFSPGLGNATGSIGGTYDNGSSGPRDTIEPLVGGAAVTLVRKPEGTGSGLPQDSVSVLVTSYVETSPVADMVSWSCEFQCTDAVTSSNQ
jgi:hypothetical protein